MCFRMCSLHLSLAEPKASPSAATAANVSAPSWAYACPPGGQPDQASGACVLTLSDPAQSYQEPFVALDPANPQVLAVGFNAGQLADAGAGGTQSAMKLGLLVSEDGGATWARRDPPQPPTSLTDRTGSVAALSGDAAMAFGLDGTLHVTGMWIPAATLTGQTAPQHLYYARSADLGRTWTHVQLPAYDPVGQDDRNWMSRAPDGTIWVTNHEYAKGQHQVGKVTVDGLDMARTDGCATPSAVVFVPGPLLACTPYTGDPGLQVRALGGTGETTLVRFPRDDVAFGILSSEGRMVAGVAEVVDTSRSGVTPTFVDRKDGADDAFLFWSLDGGATWRNETVKGLLPLASTWTFLSPRAVGVWQQQVHLLLEGGEQACYRGAACVQGEGKTGHRVVHAVLDGNGTLLQADVLPTPAPTHAAPLWFDDFHSMAFDGDRGVLAWDQDGGIDLTFLHAGPAGSP